MSGTTMVIAIVAIICWTIVEMNNSKKSKKNASNGASAEEVESLKSTIVQLQDRVATLEKIVTDEKYDLNRQFEDLKNDSGRAA